MIISVISDQHKNNRVIYTLEFILRTLGYDHHLISPSEKVTGGSLVITYLKAEEISKFGNLKPLHIFQSDQLNNLEELEKTINLFDWNGLSLPILGKQLTPGKQNWRFQKTDGIFKGKDHLGWYLGFDLIANVFYHLSRYEEKWRHFAEETATDYSTSILSRYQQLKVPVADVLLEYVDRLIQKRASLNGQTLIKIMNWPAAEDFGVALTHDVDLTRGVTLKEKIVSKSLGMLQILRGANEERKRRKKELEERDAIYWSYPQLISFYESQQWHSTFFFLTRIFEGLHVRYNISSKKFRRLIGDLQKSGHEIGLHSSLKAFDKRGRYKQEKEKLEAVLGEKSSGLRQHYLRAKYPRLWKLAEHAGFSYDSSLSYNFQAGFRAGTSHAFQTYEYDEDRVLSVIEFSLLCFENNLPVEEGAEDVIEGLIKQVARFNGIFVALWHPSNFIQEPHRSIWNFMIERLKKNTIYVSTLSEHLDWYNGRSAIKILLEKKAVSIQNPAGLNSFAVRILGNKKIISIEGAEFEKRPENVYLINTSRKKISLILSK